METIKIIVVTVNVFCFIANIILVILGTREIKRARKLIKETADYIQKQKQMFGLFQNQNLKPVCQNCGSNVRESSMKGKYICDKCILTLNEKGEPVL